MAVLLIILLATAGLGIRAELSRQRWDIADSDTAQDASRDIGLLDACARTFLLVLVSLLGLLVLGVTYGNVLGAVPAAH